MNSSSPRLLWTAAIADYRVSCLLTEQEGESALVVVENGREIERHQPGCPSRAGPAGDLAASIGERYVSQVVAKAKQHWRARGIGCLTSHGLRFSAADAPSPDAQD